MMRWTRAKCLPQRAAGLSLVELMVAMTLGLLIVGAVIQVFVTSRLTYNVNEGLGRVQESARFAMEVLQRDVRMAGSTSTCGGRPPELVNWARNAGAIPEMTALLNNGLAVRGWEYEDTATGDFEFDPTSLSAAANMWSDGSTDLPGYLQGRAQAGSDVLAVSVFEVGSGNVTGCASNEIDNVNISTCNRTDGAAIAHGVAVGELWAAGDCRVAVEVCRQTASGNATTLNCAGVDGNNRPTGTEWRVAYRADMELYLPRISYYYVGLNPAGRRALFRASNCTGAAGGPACRNEELVEGVDSLQVFYLLSGSPGTLVDASQVNDWNQVVGVVVNLVVSSPDEVDGRQVSQNLVLDNDLVFQTNDRRVRQVYPATIAIRNRLEVF